MAYVRSLGAETVVDYQTAPFEDVLSPVDAVIDTVGGEVRDRSLPLLKPAGILVSAVSLILDAIKQHYGARAVFFLVDVTTAILDEITRRFDSGKLLAQVGDVLPLQDARLAHEMLAGAPNRAARSS